MSKLGHVFKSLLSQIESNQRVSSTISLTRQWELALLQLRSARTLVAAKLPRVAPGLHLLRDRDADREETGDTRFVKGMHTLGETG